MKKILSIVLLMYLSTNMSLANQFGGMDAGSINRQNMIDLRLHEAQTRAKNNNAIIQSNKKEIEEAVTSSISSNIKKVVFLDNNSISSRELLNTISDKINQPMTPENISVIRREIMKYYQQRGYYSAVVMVASQNPKEGELVLEVKEGGKNSIIIQE